MNQKLAWLPKVRRGEALGGSLDLDAIMFMVMMPCLVYLRLKLCPSSMCYWLHLDLFNILRFKLWLLKENKQ
jgi:hypothetical protein